MLAGMLNSLRLAVILCIALTGIGLGAARGTVLIGGQVVLCSGHAVVVLLQADEGGPDGHAHLCPDMALSLLHAIASNVPLAAPQRRVLRAAAASAQGAMIAHDPPPALARAPPA